MRTTLAGLTLVCVSTILISLMFTCPSSAVDPATVVGAWLFDEGSGTTAADISGNGNDGEILGEPAWVDGVFGKALEFDGSDSINCGNDLSLDLTEEFTLMAWGRYTTEDSIDYMNHTGCNGYFLATWTNKVNFPQQCDAASAIGEPVNDGEWHHVAGVWAEGEGSKLYYDGELHVEVPDYVPTAPFANTGNLLIGCYGNMEGEFFVGTMDEVAVFNVVLSEDGIRDIVTSGLAAALGGPTAVSPEEKLTTVWGKIKAE